MATFAPHSTQCTVIPCCPPIPRPVHDIEFFLQSIDVPLHDFKYLYASFDLAFFLYMVR